MLIVSTDPASNLDEVLGTRLGAAPTAIPDAPGLFALNIDPAAARDYRERMVAPYRGILPAGAIQSMEEQFSGARTVEIAAFDEFSAPRRPGRHGGLRPRHLRHGAHRPYPCVCSPCRRRGTGSFLSTGGAFVSARRWPAEQQEGPLRGHRAALADPADTTGVLVSRPEAALGARLSARATANGAWRDPTCCWPQRPVPPNARTTPSPRFCPAGLPSLADMPAGLADRPAAPSLPPTALALRSAVMAHPGRRPAGLAPMPTGTAPGLIGLVEDIAAAGHGVMMTMRARRRRR